MLSHFSGSMMNLFPCVLAFLGVFTLVTMWAVLVTEGCRKIKLQYYGFKLASTERAGSPVTEVEPYIPFNINPTGMQSLLAASYLLAFPSILASILGSPFWENVREILNLESSLGAAPCVYYTIYAIFVFLFKIFDIANLPKEIADYMNKMGARIPNIKPGRATIEHLTKIQASTRFWGGLLLTALATSSTLVDHYLRCSNLGFSVGFTSVLIITGSGKTLAYLLAIFSLISFRRSAIQALIVVPTRELGIRVTKVARLLVAKPTGSDTVQRTCTIMALLDGGMLKRHKSWLKADPPEIIIATIGSVSNA